MPPIMRASEGIDIDLHKLRRSLLGAGLCLCAALATVAAYSPAAAGGSRCLGKPTTITGSGGSERIDGTNGDDVIAAGGGSDYVLGKGGDDLICGDGGHDHLVAGGGRDRIAAGRGIDSLVAGRSTRYLDGAAGNDTFFPNGGQGGTILGGGGRDWLVFTDRPCARGVTVDLADRRATYRGCDEGWDRGTWTVRSVERVDGSRGGDLLIGSDRRNQLLGQDGRDVLRGLGAGDRLHGGVGRDRGRGGAGADRCTSVEVQSSC